MKRASRSSGFAASPNTNKQDESCGSTTDTEHLESSVLRESRSQPMFTSTPVSTDSKILEHFDQMRTLISGFLQQKSDRQPFFDYVASEAEKMTEEEFEDLKGRIFRDIESIKTNRRHQPLATRVKRHYHILTNPQTHKPNTKPNPPTKQHSKQIPNLTTNPQTHKPNTKHNHQPRNRQTQ